MQVTGWDIFTVDATVCLISEGCISRLISSERHLIYAEAIFILLSSDNDNNVPSPTSAKVNHLMSTFSLTIAY